MRFCLIPSPSVVESPSERLLCAWVIAASILMLVLVFWPAGKVMVFHGFNNLGPLAPSFWSGMTAMADTYLALGLLLPVILWRPRVAAMLLVAALIATAITHSIKPLLDVLRPPAVLPADSMYLIGHKLSHKSFPSGHATTAFVLAGLIITGLRLRLSLTIVTLGFASVLAISRLAVGVHWPTDILAGSVIGLLSVLLGNRLLDRYWTRLRDARWAPPTGIVVTGICALSAPWFDVGYPLGIWANWAVAWLGLWSLLLGMFRYWPLLKPWANRGRLGLRQLGAADHHDKKN